jgi:hypothetical protein
LTLLRHKENTYRTPPAQTDGRDRQVKSAGLDRARIEKVRRIISGLLAGLSYVIIDVVTGGGIGSAIGPAVIVGLMTFALTF